MIKDTSLRGKELKSPKAYANKYSEYGCFNPECKSGYNLEVHHSDFRKKMTALWVHKFYFESLWESEDDNKVPTVWNYNNRPENLQKRHSPEVLQTNVQVVLPQQAQSTKTNKRFLRRPNRATKKTWSNRLAAKSFGNILLNGSDFFYFNNYR